MKSPIFSIVFKIVSGLTMLRFARPKLMGLSVSVKSFTQFGEFLNINGTTFMHFTGYLELVTALILIGSIFTKNWKYDVTISVLGWMLLIGTMSGALFTEFVIRTEPVLFLVQIATTLILISIAQLLVLFRKEKAIETKPLG